MLEEHQSDRITPAVLADSAFISEIFTALYVSHSTPYPPCILGLTANFSVTLTENQHRMAQPCSLQNLLVSKIVPFGRQ